MTNINYTHNFFPYPAKFPPGPIRAHILNYSSKGDSIIDPFCGSGTVLVESILSGRNATGIDLNPVSCLISKAKSIIYTQHSLRKLESQIAKIKNAQSDYSHWLKNTLTNSAVQYYDNIEHWFKPEMIKELSAIKISLLDHSDEDVSRLLWMGFLSIMISCSKQESDTRYAAIDKPEVQPGYGLQKLIAVVEGYLKVLKPDSKVLDGNTCSTEVFEGDSSKVLREMSKNSFQLSITSPPYINTFDYYLYHKHRIFWMDKNPRDVRQKEIGCHHKIDTQTFEVALDDYTNSLSDVLAGLHHVLVKNGHSVWLIGDGIVKKEVVKADKLIRELAKKTGFAIEEIDSMNLRNVSRGFIKGKTLDLKKHHTIILKRR